VATSALAAAAFVNSVSGRNGPGGSLARALRYVAFMRPDESSKMLRHGIAIGHGPGRWLRAVVGVATAVVAAACEFDTAGLLPLGGLEVHEQSAGSPISYAPGDALLRLRAGEQLAEGRSAELGVQAGPGNTGAVVIHGEDVIIEADPAMVQLQVEIERSDLASPPARGVLFEVQLRRPGGGEYRTVRLPAEPEQLPARAASGRAAAEAGPGALAPGVGVAVVPYFWRVVAGAGELAGGYAMARRDGTLGPGGTARVALPTGLAGLEFRLRPRPAVPVAGTVHHYRYTIRKLY
jgi:hypothetical protein